MQDLKITYLPIEQLIPYENNARTHSEQQIKQIVKSIKQFNFTNPILIDEEGYIIAGHGRLEAALQLKLTSVPTIMLTGLSAAQRKAYVIADNKLALNAGWDFEMLAAEIDGLNDLGFDLDLLGFSQDELNDLIGNPNSWLGDDDLKSEDESSQDLCQSCKRKL